MSRLSQVAERGAAGASDEELLGLLAPAMYLPLGDKAAAWVHWLRRWLRAQGAEGGGGAEAARRMRLVSPKYIPREWMLAEAYTGAEPRGIKLPRGSGQFGPAARPASARSSSGRPPASGSLGSLDQWADGFLLVGHTSLGSSIPAAWQLGSHGAEHDNAAMVT